MQCFECIFRGSNATPYAGLYFIGFQKMPSYWIPYRINANTGAAIKCQVRFQHFVLMECRVVLLFGLNIRNILLNLVDAICQFVVFCRIYISCVSTILHGIFDLVKCRTMPQNQKKVMQNAIRVSRLSLLMTPARCNLYITYV